eukprot:XP_011667833.1 PREDICTED: neurogenic locus notch homolog protein 1-like [Strongylocentrotus purpuratus]
MLHGQCVENTNGYSCVCETGWIGSRCDLDSSQWTCSNSTDRCYNRSPSKLDYDGAIAYCSGLNPVSPIPETGNTSLLFVSTGAEIGEVQTILAITDQYVWINCNDRVVEGEFICEIDANGTTTPARNWEPDQPSVGTSQQCVAVSTVHTQWEDKSCGDNYDTVCQIYITSPLDIDECASNPCQNGQCTDDVYYFSCSCDAGWEGDLCDQVVPVNVCASNPCSYTLNGQCAEIPNGYTCDCDTGWTGPRCDLNSSQWECSGTTARCYNRSPSKVDYDDAIAYCGGLNPVSPLPETVNTSLLFVSTGTEINEVQTIFGITDQYVWVNCNDRVVEGEFICVIDANGTTTDARNWRSNQPGGGSSQQCVAVSITHTEWEDKSCDDNYDTVCQIYVADLDHCTYNPCQNGECVSSQDTFACTCNAGWSGDLCDKEWKCTSTKCFHLLTEENTFSDAVAYCDSLNPVTLNQTIVTGTRNASILFVGSDADINEVEDLFDFFSSTRHVWVNCFDDDSDTNFVCTADDEGTLTDIRNWESTQPNGDGSQDCVAVVTNHNKWEDKRCTDTYNTVCQIYRVPVADINECATNPCQNGVCTDGLGVFTCTCDEGWGGDICDTIVEWKCTATKCFHLLTEENTFSDAVGYCDSLNPVTLNQTIVTGTRNASILFVGSDAEITEVEDLFDFFSSSRHVWVNCIDEDSDSNFVCTMDDEGTLTDIRNFRYDQPNGGNQDCMAVVTNDNKWQDKSCSDTYNTVCQIYRVPVADIDECASNPCLNGSCTDGLGMYTCTCDEGWSGHFCQVEVEWKCTDTRCFHVSTEELGFYDAVIYCDSLNPVTLNQTIVSGNRNASVLFVGSDAAINEVEDLFDFFSSTREVWVNCVSEDSDADFVCTADDKGTLTNITHWRYDQPDDDGGQNCVIVKTNDNKWKDKGCEETYNTVCQIYRVPVEDIDECATGNPCVNGTCVDGIGDFTCACNHGWIGDLCEQAVEWKCSQTKCFHMYLWKQIFDDAVTYCSSLSPATVNATVTGNSSVLFVGSDAEIIEVETLLGISNSEDVWVNCNDRQTDDDFQCFSDAEGTLTNVTNWLSGQPNGGSSQQCVIVDTDDDKWEDKACDSLYTTVCQIVI